MMRLCLLARKQLSGKLVLQSKEEHSEGAVRFVASGQSDVFTPANGVGQFMKNDHCV